MKKNEIVLFEEQKESLKYVREKMREIMECLTDPKVPMAEKKLAVQVYNTINNSAKNTISTCITEIAIEKLTMSSLEETEEVEIANEQKLLL